MEKITREEIIKLIDERKERCGQTDGDLEIIDLSEKDLSGIDLNDLELLSINFDKCDLSDTRINNATFRYCSFNEATFNFLNIYNANICYCSFCNATINKMTIQNSSIRNCNAKKSEIQSINFCYSVLYETTLEHADISRGSRIMHSSLHNVNLNSAKLNHTYVKFCELTNCKFIESDLKDCAYISAYITGSDFCSALLRDCTFEKSCLRDVSGRKSEMRYINVVDSNISCMDISDSDLANICNITTNFVSIWLNNCTLFNVSIDCCAIILASIRNAHLKTCSIGDSYNIGDASTLTHVDFTQSIFDDTIIGASVSSSNCCFESCKMNSVTGLPTMACPSEGSFIGWKKLNVPSSDKKVIVKLEIPADAKRSSAASNKCRCDKAKVLEFQDEDGNILEDRMFKSKFVHKITEYIVGEMVYPDSFDEDRWAECGHGIHFFVDRQAAVNYMK